MKKSRKMFQVYDQDYDVLSLLQPGNEDRGVKRRE
jgi:hypothetical protein